MKCKKCNGNYFPNHPEFTEHVCKSKDEKTTLSNISITKRDQKRLQKEDISLRRSIFDDDLARATRELQ